ncbi:hypothetical protein [Chromobacterium sp. CV08]|uniref:hypothetical protein n=1 Tax=Chromobacterium sp. CV08 TaxID=3133274 RepID=UPI003DA7F1DB
MSLATVTVKNHSSHDIYIDGDPDWDGQALLIDGQPLQRGYRLPPDWTAEIGTTWRGPGSERMLGVIFADGPAYGQDGDGFYRLSIGQLPDGGLLDVTDGDGEAKIRYTACPQTEWAMLIDFADN